MGISNPTKPLIRPLAILGGAFDPIHHGHLWLATAAVRNFSATVRLLPNGAPPHRRPPIASWTHRLAMCRLAARGLRHIEVADDEPPGKPRYTIDSLRALRKREPTRTLLLIVGADAFADIKKWHQWPALFEEAHIVVAARAGILPSSPDDDIRQRFIRKAALTSGHGGVYQWRCCPPAVTATDIRAALASDGSPTTLASDVLEYAKKMDLYS